MGSLFRLAMLLGALGWAQSPLLADGDIIPPYVEASTPLGVNIGTGQFSYSTTDLAGGGLTLTRFTTERSAKAWNRPDLPFGLYMSHNFDMYVSENYTPATTYYAASDQPVVHLGSSASGVYRRVPGTNTIQLFNDEAVKSGRLTFDGTDYTYTDRSGAVYSFSAAIPKTGVTGSQMVTQIVYPDGRRTNFSYVSGNLRLVTDTTGWAIAFELNGANDISSACLFNLARTNVSVGMNCSGSDRTITYAYDTNGALKSATDPQGGTTQYQNNHGVTCIIAPGESVCPFVNTYTLKKQRYIVTQQTTYDNKVYSINVPYGLNSSPDAGTDELNCDLEGGYSGPLGTGITATFTRSTPCSITDANGNRTQVRFNGSATLSYQAANLNPGEKLYDGSFMEEATTPERGKYLAEYDGGAFKSISKETVKPKPGSTLDERVKTYIYACTATPCATKPTKVTDPRDNATDFTYDTTHGGVLTETGPADDNGVRPQTRYSYAQKYTWLKASGGGFVQSAHPIWMLVSEEFCRSSAASGSSCAAGAGDEVVTTYEYEQGSASKGSNLLLLGVTVTADGTTLRTCYEYDDWGRKIGETQPAANLSSCS